MVNDLKKADLLLVNGKVITVDSRFSIQQAIAVKNGWIVAVGTDDEIKGLKGSNTQIIDLKGRPLLPGTNDTHTHAVCFGGTRPPLCLDLMYPNAKSISDMVKMLKDEVEIKKPGEWIRGFGWDLGFLEECKNDPERLPRKWDFDAVSPDNPIAFNDFSAHTLVVNSKALELAGVDKNTPDPGEGLMERDPDTGEPTGVFMEFAAQALVNTVIPLYTMDELRQAAVRATDEMNKNGITSFTDAALGPGGNEFAGGLLGERCIEVYKNLHDEGELTARVTIGLLMGRYGSISHDDLQTGLETIKLPRELNEIWLRIPTIKVFADGIPMTKTAWMWEPYLGGGYGALCVPGASDDERYEELMKIIRLAHDRGYQLAIHVVGDRASDAAVDGIVQAMHKNPRGDPRHYLLHGDNMSPECARRMAINRIGLSMQPYIKAQIADILKLSIGEERAAYNWPMRTVLNAGTLVSGSSDTPCTYPNWLLGVQAAVLRESWASGQVSGPDECITVEEAITMYTINGAWQDHMDNIKGSIEVGKLADLQILGADILSVDPHEIGQVRVMMTLVGGKVVYESS
jgi:predicted amidohydrolase YtcJ